MSEPRPAASINRRIFLERSVAAAIGLAAGRHLLAQGTPRARTTERTQRFTLELNGVFAGWIDQFAGGGVSSNQDELRSGATGRGLRNLGPVESMNVTLDCGPYMREPFVGFLRSAINSNDSKPVDVTISGIDQGLKTVRRIFGQAVLDKIAFPAVNVSDTHPVLLTLWLHPSEKQLIENGPRGNLPDFPAEPPVWDATQFRFIISGVDSSKIQSVESVVASRVVVAGAAAGAGSPAKPTVGPWQAMPITLVAPLEAAPAFEAWRQKMLTGQQDLRDGIIEYGPPDHPHYRVQLTGLRTTAVVRERTPSTNVKVQMLCGAIQLL